MVNFSVDAGKEKCKQYKKNAGKYKKFIMTTVINFPGGGLIKELTLDLLPQPYILRR
jgi:hypothetical protein